MNTLDVTIRDVFIVTVLLVILAFFAGFVTDFKTVTAGVNTLLLTASGRNSQGNFVNYPGNAPAT